MVQTREGTPSTVEEYANDSANAEVDNPPAVGTVPSADVDKQSQEVDENSVHSATLPSTQMEVTRIHAGKAACKPMVQEEDAREEIIFILSERPGTDRRSRGEPTNRHAIDGGRGRYRNRVRPHRGTEPFNRRRCSIGGSQRTAARRLRY